ncbi:MAG: hypothetical protein M1837_002911 [Sclerophora amabilis]|nr:MAG: hypothetical protein M1837_002911 [Sclerophora amabilis]
MASVCKSISECLVAQDFIDLTLICGKETFKVHKLVVCSQSKVLRAACVGVFKEAASDSIELHDELVVVERLVQFFYEGDYPDLTEPPVSNQKDSSVMSNIKLHALMYAAADKYDISALTTEAKKRFEKSLAKFPTNLSVLSAVNTVYTTTPDSDHELRDILVNYIRTRRHSILIGDGSESLFWEAVRSIPDFAANIIHQLVFVTDQPSFRGKFKPEPLLTSGHSSKISKRTKQPKPVR